MKNLLRCLLLLVVVASCALAFLVVVGESDLPLFRLILIKGGAMIVLYASTQLGITFHKWGVFPTWWYKYVKGCNNE